MLNANIFAVRMRRESFWLCWSDLVIFKYPLRHHFPPGCDAGSETIFYCTAYNQPSFIIDMPLQMIEGSQKFDFSFIATRDAYTHLLSVQRVWVTLCKIIFLCLSAYVKRRNGNSVWVQCFSNLSYTVRVTQCLWHMYFQSLQSSYQKNIWMRTTMHFFAFLWFNLPSCFAILQRVSYLQFL